MLSGAECLPTLRADRLELRSLADRDVPALFEIFSDAEALRYWSHGPFVELSEASAYLDETRRGFADRSFFQWAVAGREDDALIGTCTLWQIDEANRRAEIGFVLGRAHWGQGLMTEALTTLFAFSFGELGLRRLEADVDPDNRSSIRLLERLGFRREGHLRERWLVDGQVADSLFYGLLQRDWSAAQGRA